MFAEFAVAKELRREAFELATAQAYQTVRIWVMTKSRKRLPSFEAVLGKDANVATGDMNPTKARAFLEVLAARMGGQVRYVKKPSKGRKA